MDIYQLIDKYFDGTTTAEQEVLLRKMLASGDYHGDDIDEACAVMGIFAAKRRMVTHKRSLPLLSTLTRAACTAAVIIGSVFLFRHMCPSQPVFAEINGRVVSQGQAIAQMQSDFDLFAETYDEMSRQIADDFASMSEIFK